MVCQYKYNSRMARSWYNYSYSENAIVPSSSAASSQKSGAVVSGTVLPTDEDDEFVIISLCSDSGAANEADAPSTGLQYLKAEYYYVLHALVATLASLGSVSVTLFDEYTTRTTSMVFRQQFVKAMVSIGRLIEGECKQLNGHRATFVTRLIESGATAAGSGLIHHATTAALEKEFLRSVQVVAEPPANGQTKIVNVVSADWRWDVNWTLHSAASLQHDAAMRTGHATPPRSTEQNQRRSQPPPVRSQVSPLTYFDSPDREEAFQTQYPHGTITQQHQQLQAAQGPRRRLDFTNMNHGVR